MIEAISTLYEPAARGLSVLGWASLYGGVALGLAWAVCRAFPRLPARWRCWLWRLAFLKLLLCLVLPGVLEVPLLPSSLSGWSPARAEKTVADQPETAAESGQPSGTELGAVQTHTSTGFAASSTSEFVETHTTPGVPSPAPATASLGGLTALVVLGLWGMIVLGLVGLTIHRVFAARRWRRECVLVKDPEILTLGERLAKQFGLVQPPLLFTAEFCRSPVVFGAVRTAIVLPEALLEGMTPSKLRLILAHEMAHIRRGDLLGNWFVSIVSGLFFFHPLVWLGLREIRLAQETACDELALGHSGGPVADYGDLIVDLATRFRRTASPVVAVGLVESFQNSLKRRIRAMKDFGTESMRMALLGWFLAAVAVVGLLPWRVVAQSPADTEAKTEAQLKAEEKAEEAAVAQKGPYARATSGKYTVTVDGARRVQRRPGIDMEFTGFPMIPQKTSHDGSHKEWSSQSPDGSGFTSGSAGGQGGGMGGGFGVAFSPPNMVLDVKVERSGSGKNKWLVCEVNGKVRGEDDLGNTLESPGYPASIRTRMPGVEYPEGSGRTAIHLHRPKASNKAQYLKSLEGELVVVEAKQSRVAFQGKDLTKKTTKRDGNVSVELTELKQTPEGIDLVVTPSPAPLKNPNDMFERMRRLQTSGARMKVTLEDTLGRTYRPTQTGSTSGGSGGSYSSPGGGMTRVGGSVSGGGMVGGMAGGSASGGGNSRGGMTRNSHSFNKTWGTPNNGGRFVQQSGSMQSSSGIECHFDPLPAGAKIKAVRCTITDHIGEPEAVPFRLTNIRLP
ncbi:MAG: M56 family metallopeptidase [Pirellulales bacterium]|nr:M56 family metallopeptidase [Pirellulales bacterium]